MKHAVLFLWLISLSAVFGQQPTSKKTPAKKATPLKSKSNVTTAKKTAVAVKPKPKPAPTPLPLSEKEQFEKASAFELAADRVPALEKFLTAFPQSENRAAAAELLATSRLLIAEEKLISGDTAGAVTLFKLVVEQIQQPIPDDVFSESISRIPSTLFFRGQRSAALELAAVIETKVEGSSTQLLEIANFHLATENGAEAMRVAAKAAAKDPASGAVQRTVALAHRINFDLELSADAYAKSLELEPESVASKRGLAEMKRALGKSDEAVALYRELLAKNESDLQSRTGLILALFDSGKRSDAEAEMARSLGQTPGNVILLSGAAYWYASKGLGDRSVELGEKAVAREPRYIWAHIALARGLMSQKKPVEAEQVLVKARAYGNFPTLEYELASARMSAGFFREAAEDLQKQFTVADGGNVKTNLGGRVVREEKSLFDLVAFERKASIFTPGAADTVESAETLKALLIFDHKLQAAQPDETEVAAAADAFAAGSDKMKIHRQLHAASMLLQKRVSPGKVLELTRAATGNTEVGLEVANPRAAVMASELYEARATAFRRNDFLLVPDVPTQTLSAILRGRIEEIAGWALYQQSNFPDAVVRLRRSISVMPEKSAWWRSSMWRLGAALAAEGKDAEALTFYIESYKTDKPDFAKYSVVEALYRKVNGNIDGLEAKIGSDRVALTPAIREIQPSPTPAQNADASQATVPNEAPSVSGSPTPVSSEQPTDQSTASPAKSEELPKTDPTTDESKTAPAKSEELPKTDPTTDESKTPPVKSEELPKTDPTTDESKTAPAKSEELPKTDSTTDESKTPPVKSEELPKRDPTMDGSKSSPVRSEELPKRDPTMDGSKSSPVRSEELPKTEPTTDEKSSPAKSEELPKTDPTTDESKTSPAKSAELPKTEPTATDKPSDARTALPIRTELVVEQPSKPVPVEAQPAPASEAAKSSTESKVLETKTDPPVKTVEGGQTAAATGKPAVNDPKTPSTKSLFEPIIIRVPSSRPTKLPTDASKVKKEDPSATESAAIDDEKKPDDTSVTTGAARLRLIDGREVRVDEIQPCRVGVSQENISLINGGGTLGILVSVDAPGDIKTLTAVSSSPKDIELTLQPEIGGIADRRFYVIKSISSALGVYQVTFETPCGKKGVVITIR